MSADNPFGGAEHGIIAPALSLFAITKSDSTDLPTVVRRIYVGGGGSVTVVDTKGNTVTHANVPAGSYIGDFRVARVLSTGTDATGLIGYV